MTPNLARYINKTVFVSIPVLFDDAVCRPYKLLAWELNGSCLQSEELTQRLLPDKAGDSAKLGPVVFVPFAQMAGVLVATGAPEPPAETPPADPDTYPAPRTEPKQPPSQRAAKRGAEKR